MQSIWISNSINDSFDFIDMKEYKPFATISKLSQTIFAAQEAVEDFIFVCTRYQSSASSLLVEPQQIRCPKLHQ